MLKVFEGEDICILTLLLYGLGVVRLKQDWTQPGPGSVRTFLVLKTKTCFILV